MNLSGSPEDAENQQIMKDAWKQQFEALAWLNTVEKTQLKSGETVAVPWEEYYDEWFKRSSNVRLM